MLDKTTGGVCPYAEAEEGLRQTYGPGAFINSPYGDGLPAWCEKVQQGAAAGTPTLALLPCGARFSTAHWQEHVLYGQVNALCFIRSRGGVLGARGRSSRGGPYASAIDGYDVDRGRFGEACGSPGRVLGAHAQ
jgi:hypothetical protein